MPSSFVFAFVFGCQKQPRSVTLPLKIGPKRRFHLAIVNFQGDDVSFRDSIICLFLVIYVFFGIGGLDS